MGRILWILGSDDSYTAHYDLRRNSDIPRRSSKNEIIMKRVNRFVLVLHTSTKEIQ